MGFGLERGSWAGFRRIGLMGRSLAACYQVINRRANGMARRSGNTIFSREKSTLAFGCTMNQSPEGAYLRASQFSTAPVSFLLRPFHQQWWVTLS
jgi:hypothetical protein